MRILLEPRYPSAWEVSINFMSSYHFGKFNGIAMLDNRSVLHLSMCVLPRLERMPIQWHSCAVVRGPKSFVKELCTDSNEV